MSRFPPVPPRIVAFAPFYRGLGFVVLGRGKRLLGSGIKRTGTGDKRVRCQQHVADVLRYYQPAVIVVGAGQGRAPWIQALLQDIARLAKHQQIACQAFPPAVVHATLAPQTPKATKQQLVAGLLATYPELAHKQPRPRKLWTSEDVRMHIFEALALAVVFYTHHRL